MVQSTKTILARLHSKTSRRKLKNRAVHVSQGAHASTIVLFCMGGVKNRLLYHTLTLPSDRTHFLNSCTTTSRPSLPPMIPLPPCFETSPVAAADLAKSVIVWRLLVVACGTWVGRGEEISTDRGTIFVKTPAGGVKHLLSASRQAGPWTYPTLSLTEPTVKTTPLRTVVLHECSLVATRN